MFICSVKGIVHTKIKSFTSFCACLIMCVSGVAARTVLKAGMYSCMSQDELITFCLLWAEPKWVSFSPTDWSDFCRIWFGALQHMCFVFQGSTVMRIWRPLTCFLSLRRRLPFSQVRLGFSQHAHKILQIHSDLISTLPELHFCV